MKDIEMFLSQQAKAFRKETAKQREFEKSLLPPEIQKYGIISSSVPSSVPLSSYELELLSEYKFDPREIEKIKGLQYIDYQRDYLRERLKRIEERGIKLYRKEKKEERYIPYEKMIPLVKKEFVHYFETSTLPREKEYFVRSQQQQDKAERNKKETEDAYKLRTQKKAEQLKQLQIDAENRRSEREERKKGVIK